MTKSSKYGNGIAGPVMQAAVAPGRPDSGGAFAVWGKGGIGPLKRRVQRELQEKPLPHVRPELRDRPFDDFVTGAELAHLLNRFAGWPLPTELRDILIRELCGKRKGRPGPKFIRSEWDHIQDALFIPHYKRGIAIGKDVRLFLRKRKSKQSRSAKPYAIPTAREFACHYVRKWLPKFRDMTDASIANVASRRLKQRRIERGKRH